MNLRRSLRKVVDGIFWKRAVKRIERARNFVVAISHNDVERVRQMLAEGIDPNQVFNPRDGERPLHIAAGWAGPEMIDILVAAGADPLVGRRVALSSLAPSGFARLMNRPANADYLEKIEEKYRQSMIAAGKSPTTFDKEVRTLCQLRRSLRTTLSRPPVPY